MKINPLHLSYLRITLDMFLEDHPNVVRKYSVGDFPRSDKVKDLQMRFCFDMLHGAGLTKFVTRYLYKYMDDTHLYTALKTILPTVARKY